MIDISYTHCAQCQNLIDLRDREIRSHTKFVPVFITTDEIGAGVHRSLAKNELARPQIMNASSLGKKQHHTHFQKLRQIASVS